MEWLIIGITLTSFVILGISRLAGCIRMVALQGALLALLPALAKHSFSDPHGLLLLIGSFTIKAVAIPFFLFRSLKEARIKQEVEPIVSLHLSMVGGGAILILAFSSFRIFALPLSSFPPLIIPAALSTVLIGFLLLISRTKAIMQVIGFLVLENGVFLFGVTLLSDFPLTVEMGVLLDLLVGVFVMGIMIYHINRTFDHIDTTALSKLRDIE